MPPLPPSNDEFAVTLPFRGGDGWSRAKFPGQCAQCRDSIYRDDWIYTDDEGTVCYACGTAKTEPE